MYWADKIAQEIISSGRFKPYWVDDMTTPSGYSHLGSIRGPLIHHLIYKVLTGEGQKAKNTYVFNDFDTIDGLPSELQKDFSKYLGFPLRTTPSPEPGAGSFGEYFAQDFKKVLLELGIEAEFLSSWDMYHEGKFDGVIKEALDNSEKIQDIYQKVSGSRKKEQGWLPFQVICENCGKLGTTRVYGWDGAKVAYKCEPNMVAWAQGCGHEGKISPFGGNGKLPWKVDWPAHWKVMGVSIEGAGKDHGSSGGSYDIAMELCTSVFNYPHPYKLVYEFFLIGGKKMSSSKGLGLKAHGVTKILPPEVGRFLFTRTDYREQINFDPMGTMAIPDLFDEYDRAAEAFWTGSDPDLGRTYELAQIGEVPQKTFLPRFREVANYLQQPSVDVYKMFPEADSNVLEERIAYAKVWLDAYAPKEEVFKVTDEVSEEAKKISEKQKAYLQKLVQAVEEAKSPEELEKKIYNLAKEIEIPTKDAFSAIYLSLLGKTHGPKAAALILGEKEKAVKRFKEVAG